MIPPIRRSAFRPNINPEHVFNTNESNRVISATAPNLEFR